MFFTILDMNDLAGGEQEEDRGMEGSESSMQPVRSRRRRRDATHLIQWLDMHQGNPYPTKTEKEQLVVISGMTSRQLNDWFANARRNIRKIGFDRWRKNKASLGSFSGKICILKLSFLKHLWCMHDCTSKFSRYIMHSVFFVLKVMVCIRSIHTHYRRILRQEKEEEEEGREGEEKRE